MALRDSPFRDIKVPLTWTAAGAVAVCLVIAVTLLVTDRRETLQADAYGQVKAAADAVQRPVSGALAAPVRWVQDGVGYVGGYFFAVSENRRLKAENRQLRQVRDQVAALQDLNTRYSALLGLKTDPPIDMVAARSVTDARGPFSNARLINAGKEAGILVGNPVMSEKGLVGRVTGVTQGASRVLLLTDIASRTPVMIERTNSRAILTGDGGPNPRLSFLRGHEDPRPGDPVLTSGDGGVMPRGLPVGVAVKGVDGTWRVELSADQTRIDFVRVLKFKDFSQTVNIEQLSAPVAPSQMGGPPPPPPPPAGVAGPAGANGASAQASPAANPAANAAAVAAATAGFKAQPKSAAKAGPKQSKIEKLAAKLGLAKKPDQKPAATAPTPALKTSAEP